MKDMIILERVISTATHYFTMFIQWRCSMFMLRTSCLDTWYRSARSCVHELELLSSRKCNSAEATVAYIRPREGRRSCQLTFSLFLHYFNYLLFQRSYVQVDYVSELNSANAIYFNHSSHWSCLRLLVSDMLLSSDLTYTQWTIFFCHCVTHSSAYMRLR